MNRLGEDLLAKGLISKEQLSTALERQKVTKERLGNILVKLGFITEQDLSNFLIEKYNVPKYLEETVNIPASLQKMVDFNYVINYGIIPFKADDKSIYVGINNFNNLTEIDSLNQRLGKKVIPYFFKDSMFEKIMSDFSKFPYGVKDYEFMPFKVFSKDKLNPNYTIGDFLKVLEEFDNSLKYVIFMEGEGPVARKSRVNYRLVFDEIKRAKILDFIKQITGEDERKKLVKNGYVNFKKEFNNKTYSFLVFKSQDKFSIHVKDASSTIPDIENLGFKEDIQKYLFQVPKGLTVFTAPYRHGKSTVFSSIVGLYNKTKPFNIVMIDTNIENYIPQNKSVVTIIECEEKNQFSKKLRIANELDPDVVFVSDIPDVETLDMLLNICESGVSVFVAMDCGSISVFFEKINLIAAGASDYYLSRLADMINGIINMRLVPVKGIDRRILVYESIFNAFKLKKAIKDKNFSYIDNQLKGTPDFIPIEKKLAELFNKGTIEYDVAETFSNDLELFKRYANINI